MSVLDIRHLSREVARRIRQAFHYYAVRLMLVQEGRLVPQAAMRAPEGDVAALPRSLSLQEPTIMTTVADTGRPWLVPDVSKEPCYLPVPEFLPTWLRVERGQLRASATARPWANRASTAAGSGPSA